MKAVELFAGAGGLALGVSSAGFLPHRIVEWDRWCCDTLRENIASQSSFSNWPIPIQADVRSIDFRDLEGNVELVTGGPPCQPFSLGGKHAAQNDDRDMWPQAVRAVRQIKPLAFIFENVKGLTRASFASYLSYIERQLNYPELVRRNDESWLNHLSRLEQHHSAKRGVVDLEYHVNYRVLNAADYGIPQRRERVVFVGFRSDLGVSWSFPESTHSREALAKSQEINGVYWERHQLKGGSERALLAPKKFNDRVVYLKPWRTVRDAISDLPDPQKESDKASQWNHHRYQAGARSYPGHTGSPLDEPAKTLKAGVHGVPGGENMLVRVDGSVRYFSVRESARLQTFPDSYHFHGSWTETMRQLGNAVPVELASIVANSVYQKLVGA